MKTSKFTQKFIFVICLFGNICSFAQQKKPNTTPQQNKPNISQNSNPKNNQKTNSQKNTNVTKNNTNKPQIQNPAPKPQADDTLSEKDYFMKYVKIDSTCLRCRGYRYYDNCDGLYCYSGFCSTCKGYKKCIRCAGTQMKNIGVEGCPDCTDGKCRTCKGTGLCAKCEGTGKLICKYCGGTGLKSPQQIEAEKLKKYEQHKRKLEEAERKRLIEGR